MGRRKQEGVPNPEFLECGRDPLEANPCVSVLGPPHKNLHDGQDMSRKERMNLFLSERAGKEIEANPNAL
jgi:hypothetical protein